jgi:hypothetical protein
MDKEYQKLILEYCEKFSEGPPIFDMEDEEAVKRMKEALKSGVKMSGVDMSDLPPGAHL